METFFLACFIFGAVFTFVSAVLGFGHHGLDAGHASIHAGGGHGLQAGFHGPVTGHVHGLAGHVHTDLPDGQAGGHPLLEFNLSSVVAFLTWFGATGYLLVHVALWPLAFAVVAGCVAGLFAAVLIGAFLAKIRAGDRTPNPADFLMEGTVAKVSVTIPEGGVGEIIFTMADRRRSEAARGENGQPIARETEVAVISYDKGIATVVPWSQLLNQAAQPAP